MRPREREKRIKWGERIGKWGKSGFFVAEILWPLVWQSDSYPFLVIKFKKFWVFCYCNLFISLLIQNRSIPETVINIQIIFI
jgi:hypothetical protein